MRKERETHGHRRCEGGHETALGIPNEGVQVCRRFTSVLAPGGVGHVSHGQPRRWRCERNHAPCDAEIVETLCL